MKGEPEFVTALMADLAADPSAAALCRPGAHLLVLRGERIVHATGEGARIAGALAGADGSVDPAAPVAARLRLLASGLAPRSGARLERLRLDPGSLQPIACACRIVDVGGEAVLVCALVDPPRAREAEIALPADPLPAEPTAPPPPEVAEEEAEPPLPYLIEPGPSPAETLEAPEPEERLPDSEPALESAADPAEDDARAARARVEAIRASAPVRFIWQADAQTRFTFVSESLAAIVGAGNAAVVGRTWADVAAELAEDASGIVADVLARRETWSGRTVHWRVDDEHAVPVDLAGMAVLDRERRLVGYRGFGLVRTDAVAERPRPVAPAVVPEEAEAAGPAEVEDEQPEPQVWLPDASGESAGPVPEPLESSELEPEPEFEPFEPEAVEPEFAEPEIPEPEAETDEPVEVPDDEPVSEIHTAPAESVASVVSAPSERDGLTPPAPANDAPAGATSPVLALSGMVRARFGDPAPPLRPVQDQPPAPSEVAGPDTAKPSTTGALPPIPRLTMSERTAFREIAKALGARFEEDEPTPAEDPPETAPVETAPVDAARDEPAPPAAATPADPVHAEPETDFARILDRLPVGVLIHRGEALLFANRMLLDLTGHEGMEAIGEEGGLPRLFRGRAGELARAEVDTGSPIALATRGGESVAVDVRLTTVDWDGAPASLMLVRRVPEGDPVLRLRSLELDLRARESRLRELSAVLDTATDGVIVLDEIGRILSLNRSAEALFGYDQNEVTGEGVTILLTPESHAVALDYLEGLRSNGVASLFNDGREVTGRVRQGGSIPLFMTMGQITEGADAKFCAVLRDITAFKKAESELVAAKRSAEIASAQKSEFLAKISHEIRTPLNAILGFAEVMLEERFGAIGSERYRDYLRDIHSSGEHVISLVNDLLDLAKVEAGRLELNFTGVALNDLVSACVALLQPQASRERIVMRTSFAARLPPVVADERSLRQIVLNLVSNAIKFTDAGGQVIVSTAMTDRGEVAFRVRDTGIGMSGTEIEAALEPFRQLATSRKGGGTGLGLPLTKALVEANRGALQISSSKGEGTLVEVLFPPTRVLAE